MDDYCYKFSGKTFEAYRGLNRYDFHARQYDPALGLFDRPDPMAMEYPWLNPYLYCAANPVMHIDPTGLSTHTSADGTVVAVYDDGDLGVYCHDVDFYTVQKILDDDYTAINTSAGGRNMGETYFWDEFLNPETGLPMTYTKIQFGTSFDSIIDQYHEYAESMNLIEIARESKPGGIFDIKAIYNNVGALLNGKYVSSRSAGNFLAGYNAQEGKLMNCSITFETFQKLAGALHIENSNSRSLSKSQMADILTIGRYYPCSNISKFVSPYWGEQPYQYRMSKIGWNYEKK